VTGAATPASVRVAGPFFEDLERGHVERAAPALTLTEGHAALHQAILGGRLRLALDASLSRHVVGGERALAHPGRRGITPRVPIEVKKQVGDGALTDVSPADRRRPAECAARVIEPHIDVVVGIAR